MIKCGQNSRTSIKHLCRSWCSNRRPNGVTTRVRNQPALVHFFFIPVIPLEEVVQIVQCGSCSTRCNLPVLDIPTERELAVALPNAVSSAVCLVLRATPASAQARARAIDAVRFVGGESYSEADLDVEMARPIPEVQQRLALAGKPLTPEARERVLAEAARVGLSDGLLTTEERNALAMTGQALSLTAAQFHGVIGMVEQGPGPQAHTAV